VYPLNVFSLFPPFPREDRVFVAMSFDTRFDRRWAEVIMPGVRDVDVNGAALEPYRVDARRVSDSVLTEILTGISNSRLFFADLTTMGCAQARPIRNGNVMYEVGLAHAVRLPEEVILFRSDTDPLLFDVANIRVNEYDPDGSPELAGQKVTDALKAALREVELQKHLAVQRAVASLDYSSCRALLHANAEARLIRHPLTRTVRDVVSNVSRINAIHRLLDLRAISAQYAEVTPDTFAQMADGPAEEIVKYQVTAFGEAVIAEVARRLGILAP